MAVTPIRINIPTVNQRLPWPSDEPIIVDDITDGIRAIVERSKNLGKLNEVKGIKYVKISLGLPGIKKRINTSTSNLSCLFKNSYSFNFDSGMNWCIKSLPNFLMK